MITRDREVRGNQCEEESWRKNNQNNLFTEKFCRALFIVQVDEFIDHPTNHTRRERGVSNDFRSALPSHLTCLRDHRYNFLQRWSRLISEKTRNYLKQKNNSSLCRKIEKHRRQRSLCTTRAILSIFSFGDFNGLHKAMASPNVL